MRLRPLVTKQGGIQQLQPPDILSFGKLNLGLITTAIVSGSTVSITSSIHRVFVTPPPFPASLFPTNLDFILGGEEGDVLVLKQAAGSGKLRLRNNGNLRLDGTFTFDTTNDTVTLVFDGTNWLEISRSENG